MQGRDSGAVGSSLPSIPTHIRSTLLHLSLDLGRCNKDASSLGARFGGDALGATTQVAWYVCGASAGEVPAAVWSVFVCQTGPGVMKEGRSCQILLAASEIRASTKLREQTALATC